ncbi:hypothetical protein TNCT_285101 [Trichonephila clavata]|uniref:Uncharacterized protein n=1 Tax=Trichonephila clavata TaxID=2740835 RepID=A0A8X6FWN9_TRICU|nr:hypothetical protein TNCT_285101 [Trichonephila clavata]
MSPVRSLMNPGGPEFLCLCLGYELIKILYFLKEEEKMEMRFLRLEDGALKMGDLCILKHCYAIWRCDCLQSPMFPFAVKD